MRYISPWLLATAVIWSVISTVDYYPNDGDGTLYTKISEELAHRDIKELLYIGWYSHNKIYAEFSPPARYFYEHPPAYFILPWVLAKLGFPSSKTTLLAETLYQLTLFLFIFLVVRRLTSSDLAQWAILACLLIPVSFLYVLRPIHEIPMLALTFGSLYSILQLERWPVLSTIGLLFFGAVGGLFKGLMILPIFILILIAALYLGKPNRKILETFISSVSFSLGAYLSLTIFDHTRIAMIGDSFWVQYVQLQFWGRALENSTMYSTIVRVFSNGIFYLGAVLYYSQPWLLIAAYLLVKRMNFPRAFNRSVILFLIATVMTVFPMVVFARTSIRYIFPSFYMAAVMSFILIYAMVPEYFSKLKTRLGSLRPLDLAAITWGLSRSLAVIFVTT